MKKNHKENGQTLQSAKRNAKPRNQGDGRSRKKKKDKAGLDGFSTLTQVAGVPKSRSFHSQIPIAPVRTVAEPRPVCPICGKEIENIALSFFNANGESVHFDCVLGQVRNSETLGENQSVSYIGRGNFAVVEKDENGKYRIVKTIAVEDQKNNQQLKDYVDSLKTGGERE